jgi:hypothetical protein
MNDECTVDVDRRPHGHSSGKVEVERVTKHGVRAAHVRSLTTWQTLPHAIEDDL